MLALVVYLWCECSAATHGGELQRLGADDPAVRSAAAARLERAGWYARPVLARGQRHADPHVRAECRSLWRPVEEVDLRLAAAWLLIVPEPDVRATHEWYLVRQRLAGWADRWGIDWTIDYPSYPGAWLDPDSDLGAFELWCWGDVPWGGYQRGLTTFRRRVWERACGFER